MAYHWMLASYHRNNDSAMLFKSSINLKPIMLTSGVEVSSFGISIDEEDESIVCSLIPRILKEGFGLESLNPHGGPCDKKELQDLKDVETELFRRIKEMPSNLCGDYIAMGTEAGSWLGHSEMLARGLQGNIDERYQGLVVRTEFWNDMNNPKIFKPFSDGLMWVPGSALHSYNDKLEVND